MCVFVCVGGCVFHGVNVDIRGERVGSLPQVGVEKQAQVVRLGRFSLFGFLLLDCRLLIFLFCFFIVGFFSVELSKGCVCLKSEPINGLTLDLAWGRRGAHLSPQPFLSVDCV